MLINHCRRLYAAVAVRVIEIESGDAMLAERTGKGGAAIYQFGCVISHVFILLL